MSENNAQFLRRLFPEAVAESESATAVATEDVGRDDDLVIIDEEPLDTSADEDLPADDEEEDQDFGDRFSTVAIERPDIAKPVAAQKDSGDDTVNGRTKATLAVLGGAGALVAVVIVVMVSVLSKDTAPASAPEPQRRVNVAGSTTPPVSAAESASTDKSMPFEASADCGEGSTSARNVEDPTGDTALVCYGPGLGLGQPIDLKFSDDITAVAIKLAPGWIAKRPGGKEEWDQHRVITKIRWWFMNDVKGRYVDQDTKNVKGMHTVPVENIRTRWIRGIVMQTSRPPTDQVPQSSAPSGGGMFGGLFGSDGSSSAGNSGSADTPSASSGPGMRDAVDQSFATSRIEVIGHVPN
ncbi:hypothetical protein E3G45_005035 [Mycobacteroides abscessus]|uniref:hypothetical protein n=1 Tax=Mycobacteroides abscessus TaxID=36809 RepID=UPI001877AA98|nr:hypothetical protein [Mycobacteroides abscessus]